MADDVAVAHRVGTGAGASSASHVVLGRDGVFDAREGDEDMGCCGTWYEEGFAVVVAPGDQGVQGVGVARGGEPIGRARVDDGRLTREAYSLVVHAAVVEGDFPSVLVHGVGVAELAFEFGAVDAAECDLSVFRAVGGAIQVDADDFRL